MSDQRAQKQMFGHSVDTLIETYANCISLLKAFKRRDAGGPRQEDKHQAQLRKSLKEDRARVKRAYSSCVASTGSRFEKGDDRARTAISRVLEKLKQAITNILRSSSKYQKPAIDYESLLLLSNASRTEAIKAFDRLSHRLGSTPSKTSVAGSSTSSKRSRHKPSSSLPAAPKSKTSSRGSNGTPKRLTSPRSEEREAKATSSRREARNSKPLPQTPSPPPAKNISNTEDVPLKSRSLTPSARPKAPGKKVPNRISLASIATASTKLGEIPERKWMSGRRDTGSMSSGDYNVTPIFPLKPYEAPVRERGFLGLFRRRT